MAVAELNSELKSEVTGLLISSELALKAPGGVGGKSERLTDAGVGEADKGEAGEEGTEQWKRDARVGRTGVDARPHKSFPHKFGMKPDWSRCLPDKDF